MVNLLHPRWLKLLAAASEQFSEFANLRMSGSVKAPLINKGRPQSVKSDMMEALIDHLLEKPSLYLNEMQLFFLDEFGTHTKIHY